MQLLRKLPSEARQFFQLRGDWTQLESHRRDYGRGRFPARIDMLQARIGYIRSFKNFTLIFMKPVRLLRNRCSVFTVIHLRFPTSWFKFHGSSSISSPVATSHMKQMPCPSISRTREAWNRGDFLPMFWIHKLEISSAILAFWNVWEDFPKRIFDLKRNRLRIQSIGVDFWLWRWFSVSLGSWNHIVRWWLWRDWFRPLIRVFKSFGRDSLHELF